MPFSALAAHSWDGAVRLLAWVEIVIADPPEPRNVIQDGRWAMGFTHPKLTAVNVATGFLVPGKEGTAALVFPPRRASPPLRFAKNSGVACSPFCAC